jgi:hypothetical protein
MKGVKILKATEQRSVVLLNKGNFDFEMLPLPVEAQFSPVHAIVSLDADADGIPDLLLAGNFYDVLPEIGRYDACYGLLLRGLGNGSFETVPGMPVIEGQVRSMGLLKGSGGHTFVLVGKNNEALQLLRLHKPQVSQ